MGENGWTLKEENDYLLPKHRQSLYFFQLQQYRQLKQNWLTVQIVRNVSGRKQQQGR